MRKITVKCIKISQRNKSFYLANLPAKVVAEVSYASVRGRDKEDGAVQRVLNSRRIGSIKDFALRDGNFPNSIVINWVKNNIDVDDELGEISFVLDSRSAQLIDGQHRVEGLKEAIKENPLFSDYELPVAIYIGLSTKECADIFLAINTEQKPVQRSLVFDLYGIADETIVDQAAARSREIAVELNDQNSAYFGMIKFPGEPPRKGGVALSTVVTAIKPLVETNGVFEQYGLTSFENQSRVIHNFFFALKKIYQEKWTDKQNAFMYASGFSGAIDFLEKRIIPYCVRNKSFSDSSILKALQMNSLIYQKDLSGLSGTEAQKHIFSRLDESFVSGETLDEYEF